VGKKTGRANNSIVVRTKRVPGPNGRQVKLYVVDSNDDNFDDELIRVFSLNIDSARQANTAVFGSPDGPIDGLRGRHRDKAGKIEGRHGNTKVAALRKEYGPTFSKGRGRDMMLKTSHKKGGVLAVRRTTKKSK
jgi:hypothetical protein